MMKKMEIHSWRVTKVMYYHTGKKLMMMREKKWWKRRGKNWS